MGEMTALCEGIDEATASRAPSGRWSPKEIISHVIGPEGIGIMPMIETILTQETPRIDIEAENPFFTAARSGMSLSALLAEFEQEYSRIADRVAGLSDDQLGRTAHIPLFRETPLGEYPTLGMFIDGLADFHLSFHIDHMKEILKEPGT